MKEITGVIETVILVKSPIKSEKLKNLKKFGVIWRFDRDEKPSREQILETQCIMDTLSVKSRYKTFNQKEWSSRVHLQSNGLPYKIEYRNP